jgi:TrmH family RNA methyltransferase
MGAIYRVPHFYVDDMDALLERFAEKNVRTFAAHLRGTHSYTELDFRGGTAFFIGNESRGLTDALSDSLDVLMKIPMSGKVESLNAAMAAGILMYEARRQRGE